MDRCRLNNQLVRSSALGNADMAETVLGFSPAVQPIRWPRNCFNVGLSADNQFYRVALPKFQRNP